MIEVLLNGETVAEYSTQYYYADPARGVLYIRLFEGDVIVRTFEPEEWDDVQW